MAAARQTQAPRIPACNVSPALSAVEHVKPASTSDACPAVTADVTMQQPEACSGQTASKLQGLYPLIEAYDAGMLVVDGEVGHELYYEQVRRLWLSEYAPSVREAVHFAAILNNSLFLMLCDCLPVCGPGCGRHAKSVWQPGWGSSSVLARRSWPW